MRLPRRSGILLHLSSLPGPHGCGDLGPGARRLSHCSTSPTVSAADATTMGGSAGSGPSAAAVNKIMGFGVGYSRCLPAGSPWLMLTERYVEESVRFIRANRDRPFLLAPVVVTLLTALVFYAGHRLRVIGEPALAIAAAIQLAALWERRRPATVGD